jgi:hypothetical protein
MTKETSSKRKTLKPVERLKDKTPVTTPAVRKAAQASNREQALAHPMAQDHIDWLFKVSRGEIEAPSAVMALALKEINGLVLGSEEERQKRSTDSVSITITGIGGDSPKDVSPATVVISNDSGEVES